MRQLEAARRAVSSLCPCVVARGDFPFRVSKSIQGSLACPVMVRIGSAGNGNPLPDQVLKAVRSLYGLAVGA